MKKTLLTFAPLLMIFTAKAQTVDTSRAKPVTVTIDSPLGGDPKDGIYTVVEHAPDFPGGLTAFYHFLSTYIHYPESARKRNQQGRVIVTMVVEKNGTLADIKIIRGVSDDIDAEAIRVMKLCPKWTPGIQNGKPVRVAYAIPINFPLGK